MEWLTDGVLFYGGIGIAAASVVGILVSALILVVKKGKLDKSLTEEYGEKHAKKSGKS